MNGPSKPEHVREIYHSDVGVYTVLTTWPALSGNYQALSIDQREPHWSSHWDAARAGAHLGRRIAWAELPEHLRHHVVSLIEE